MNRARLHLVFLSRTVLVVALVALLTSKAVAEGLWALPAEISDRNTRVSFKVDSTWHMVEGSTSGLSGSIEQTNPRDSNSVKAEIHIPVINFDTQRESRDTELRKVMAVDRFPEVIVRILELLGDCRPESIPVGDSCSARLLGSISIHGNSRPIELPITINREDHAFEIDGETTINWEDFGVEDPSIIVARLDRTVTVNYHVTLKVI